MLFRVFNPKAEWCLLRLSPPSPSLLRCTLALFHSSHRSHSAKHYIDVEQVEEKEGHSRRPVYLLEHISVLTGTPICTHARQPRRNSAVPQCMGVATPDTGASISRLAEGRVRSRARCHIRRAIRDEHPGPSFPACTHGESIADGRGMWQVEQHANSFGVSRLLFQVHTCVCAETASRSPRPFERPAPRGVMRFTAGTSRVHYPTTKPG